MQVQSRGSLLCNDNKFDVIVHEPRKKGSSNTAFNTAKNGKNERTTADTVPEFDIKRSTKEIIRFGAKGLKSGRRDRTLKHLAIELGAKPEKKKYRNYKELKAIKKNVQELREKKLKAMEHATSLLIRSKYNRRNCDKPKSKMNILKDYGKRKSNSKK